MIFFIFKNKRWKINNYLKYMKANSCISQNENSWTNNILCIEWRRNYFEPESKRCLYDDNQILIIDERISHLWTQFVRFMCEHKILYLCLLARSIPSLKPLDVDIYAFLKQSYKTLLSEKTRFTTYNIDQPDFISPIKSSTSVYSFTKYTIYIESYTAY